MATPGEKAGRIYQRGSSWYVDIKNPDGSRYRRSVGSNRRQAERVLANKRADLIRQESEEQAGNGPTVAACWRHYIERMKEEGKPATIVTISTGRKRWAELERKSVSNLTQLEIDTIVDDMSCAVTTKNTSIKLLRAALRRSKKDGLLDRIPVALTERKHVVPLPITLSSEEFRRLFSACKGYRAQTLVMTARFAGLRHSEVRHLVLSDLDFDRGLLYVTAKPEHGWSPKNYQERPVPMVDYLATTLKAHVAAMGPRPSGLADNVPDWLFPGYRGSGPLTHVTTWGYVKAAYKAAKIGGDRPGMHRLRKTWATNLLKTCDLGTLMRLGGWNSLETVKRYIGSDDDAARAAIDAQEF
jgi:integrase